MKFLTLALAGLMLAPCAYADTAGPGDFKVVYLPPDTECGTSLRLEEGTGIYGLMQPKSTFVYAPARHETFPPIVIPTAPGGTDHHRPEPPRPPPSPVPVPSALLSLLGALISAAAVWRMTR
ncbi:hypothetical protein [Haematobacter genomosp. 1]|nr:hypothetical protein [Haematobacter genomosp. 1]